jgi:transposase InsO family protein
MRYTFIDKHCEAWPVRTQCRVLRVSVSGFYDWRRRDPSARQQRREQLAKRIGQIHADSRGCYGSPRVFKQLQQEGEKVSQKRVASIMRERDLHGKSPRKRQPRTTDSEHDRPVADNLLGRDFDATGPDQKWVADITYIDTEEGWSYLAAVMDCFSRRIVGWAIADHLRSELVEDALAMAAEQRGLARGAAPGDGPIHHSDRGSQYAGTSFRRLLEDHGITASMSRKADCYDNAMMESFFGTLKTELDEPLPTRAAARAALFEYLEVFYNRQRLHSALGYQSPVAYELTHQAA